MLSELADQVVTSVLTPSVSVQVLRWFVSVVQCHMECLTHEEAIMVKSDRDTYDLSCVPILEFNQIQLLSTIDNLGNISCPDMTGLCRYYSFEEMDE